MEHFALEQIWDWVKQGIIWFLVTVIFTTRELREEVLNHYHTGIIRISGACYGFNLIQGYRAIGVLFPSRCGWVRLDFVLGYCKMFILLACAVGFFLLMAQHLS